MIDKTDTDTDIATIASIDASESKFDLSDFIKGLKESNKNIEEMQNDGRLKTIINDITGKSTKTILQSLNVYNQFIELSLYINANFKKNVSQLQVHQDEINKSNKKIIDTVNRIDLTDEAISKAVDKFNLLSDELQHMKDEKDKLKASMDALGNDLSILKDETLKNLEKFNSKSDSFINESKEELDTLIIGIKEKMEVINTFKKNIEIINKKNVSIISANQKKINITLILALLGICLSVLSIIK